jgi:hypothetical protein
VVPAGVPAKDERPDLASFQEAFLLENTIELKKFFKFNHCQ